MWAFRMPSWLVDLLWRLPAITGLIFMVTFFEYAQSVLFTAGQAKYFVFAMPWLLAGLSAAIFTVGVLYTFVFVYYLNREEKLGKLGTIALLIAAGYCVICVIVIALTIHDVKNWVQFEHVEMPRFEEQFYWIAKWMFGLSIVVACLDAALCIALNKKWKEFFDIIWFDVVVALIVAATTFYFPAHVISLVRALVDDHVRNLLNDHVEAFVVSFKAGAVAFEILLACALFNPSHFLPEPKPGN